MDLIDWTHGHSHSVLLFSGPMAIANNAPISFMTDFMEGELFGSTTADAIPMSKRVSSFAPMLTDVSIMTLLM